MNPFALLFGFVLLAFSVYLAASPFPSLHLKKKSTGRGIQRKGNMKLSREKQRQAVLLALRDLDFDYQANKVADEDYHTLRADLLSEAAQLMQSQETQKDEAIEALIQSRRKERSDQQSLTKVKAVTTTERLCQNCQAPLHDGAKFCSKCGSPAVDAVCTKCGQSVSPGDHFCPACGNAIHSPTQAVHS